MAVDQFRDCCQCNNPKFIRPPRPPRQSSTDRPDAAVLELGRSTVDAFDPQRVRAFDQQRGTTFDAAAVSASSTRSAASTRARQRVNRSIRNGSARPSSAAFEASTGLKRRPVRRVARSNWLDNSATFGGVELGRIQNFAKFFCGGLSPIVKLRAAWRGTRLCQKAESRNF